MIELPHIALYADPYICFIKDLIRQYLKSLFKKSRSKGVALVEEARSLKSNLSVCPVAFMACIHTLQESSASIMHVAHNGVLTCIMNCFYLGRNISSFGAMEMAQT